MVGGYHAGLAAARVDDPHHRHDPNRNGSFVRMSPMSPGRLPHDPIPHEVQAAYHGQKNRRHLATRLGWLPIRFRHCVPGVRCHDHPATT